MPQLMPLNWIFSSTMVLIMMISAGVIYSEMMYDHGISESNHNIKDKMNYWCW